VRLLLDEFGPAPTDPGAKADSGHDGVVAVEQLMNLVTPPVDNSELLRRACAT
jgi:hypothetical protein